MNKKNYFNAVGFDVNKKPYKYRNIHKTDAGVKAFEKFCITAQHNKLPFIYVNYYHAHTKEFSHRTYFN